MLYFYKLFGADYETICQTIYYNEKEYTQEEFENLVLEVYGRVCQDIIDEEEDSLCFYNIFFTPEFIFWDNEKFKKELEQYGFYPLHDKLTATMSFDFNEGKDKYTSRLDDIFDNLSIDESCWDNECTRIQDEDKEEKYYSREGCGVYRRKIRRLPEQDCSNCRGIIECDHTTKCQHWMWKEIEY